MDAAFIIDDPTAQLADIDLSKQIAEVLHKHYPGHLWAVQANTRGGIATVRNLRTSAKWGFVIHLADLATDPRMRTVVRAGGELLERWNIARRAYSPALQSHVPQPIGYQ